MIMLITVRLMMLRIMNHLSMVSATMIDAPNLRTSFSASILSIWHKNMVCQLQRFLYRTKTGLQTVKPEINIITNLKWICSIQVPLLFAKMKFRKIVILVVYVGNLLITGNDGQMIVDLKSVLQKNFKMIDFDF